MEARVQTFARLSRNAKFEQSMLFIEEAIMFKDTKAFSSFSVNDLQKAKEFYGQTLGHKVSEKPEGLALHISGGGDVFIYPKSNHVPATFTVLNFLVDNIEKSVDDLVKAGVHFEHYEDELKGDERGIF